jgi:hypothetical protein
MDHVEKQAITTFKVKPQKNHRGFIINLPHSFFRILYLPEPRSGKGIESRSYHGNNQERIIHH